MAIYGYGKILEVDLSRGSITRKEIDPAFAREYKGPIWTL